MNVIQFYKTIKFGVILSCLTSLHIPAF